LAAARVAAITALRVKSAWHGRSIIGARWSDAFSGRDLPEGGGQTRRMADIEPGATAPTQHTQPAASVTRQVLPLALCVFLGMLSMGIPLPVIPTRVHDTLGFGPVMVGIAVGIQSAATLLTRRFAGTTCDRKGPRTAMLLGCAASAVSGLFYLISAPFGGLTGLILLMPGRLAMGMAESLIITSGLAWGMVRVGPKQAGQAMSWNGLAFYTALAAGAPIGALLQRQGFAAVGIASLIAPLGGLAIAAWLPPVRMGHGASVGFMRVLGWVAIPASGLFLANIGFACIAAFLVLDYTAHGWSGAGTALGLYAFSYMIPRILFGTLPDRATGPGPTLLLLAVECAGQAMLWLATGPVVALVGAILTGFGLSLIFPLLGVPTMRRVPPQNRGIAVGAYILFMDLSLGVAGPVAGVIAASAGLPAVFLFGAVCTLLAMGPAIAAHRLKPLRL
jgi:MFS family permease